MRLVLRILNWLAGLVFLFALAVGGSLMLVDLLVRTG